MLRLSVLGMLLLCGCETASEPASMRAPRVELAEPITLRLGGDGVGGREIRVHCGLTCDLARDEMTRLHRGCVADPTSTAHHISTSPAMIALGCCTETEAAFRDACGVEGLEPCASRWSAECESGRLGR